MNLSGRRLESLAVLLAAGALVVSCSTSGEPAKGSETALANAGTSAASTVTVTSTASVSPTPTADPAALTFGGTAVVQAGATESSLTSAGITPSAPKTHGCNTYPLPAAPSLTVVAARGTVLGVQSSSMGGDASVHTAAGVHIGDTAASVRAAYPGSTITESYSGGAGANIMLVIDNSGKALGFMFQGNSDASSKVADSSPVQSIRGGNADFAKGFEVCSG